MRTDIHQLLEEAASVRPQPLDVARLVERGRRQRRAIRTVGSGSIVMAIVAVAAVLVSSPPPNVEVTGPGNGSGVASPSEAPAELRQAARDVFASCTDQHGFSVQSLRLLVAGDGLVVTGYGLMSDPPHQGRTGEEHARVGIQCLDAMGSSLGRAVTYGEYHLGVGGQDVADLFEDGIDEMEPIYGYGDFSDVPAFDVDQYEVARLVGRCLADHGIPHEVVRNGISFGTGDGGVPPEADEVEKACRAGLSIPSTRSLTTEQIEESYAYQVAVIECLRDQGYPAADPPSLDWVIENFDSDAGAWTPYDGLAFGWLDQCPTHPVGGYGAWEPGDPITPYRP